MDAGAPRRGEVITFYSFKGGVGRSMALANIAALEAQRGKSVLALDFDFEAPGLHRYFLKPDKPGRYMPAGLQRGVLDLFAALRDRLGATFPAGQGIREADAPSKLRALVAEQIGSGNYLYKVELDDPNSRTPRTVSIDFVAAARVDATYPELVRSFDWQGFYDDYAEVFPAFVEELGSRYDLVLVDSRTGVTDIGSICTMALPDKLVLVFSPNEQSLAGALDAGWQALQGRKETGARRPLGIFPLVSRVEEGEEKLKRQWIKRARESFEKLAGAAYGVAECDLEAYFDAVRILHRGYYAYGERIAVEEEPVRESGSLAQMYDRLANALECQGVLEAQRDLEPSTRARSDTAQDFMISLLKASQLAERPSEAVRAYDDLIRRLATLQTPNVLDSDLMLAGLLTEKANALNALDRFNDSAKVNEDIIHLLGDAKDARRRALMDQAIYNLGTALAKQGRYEEASRAYDSLIARQVGSTGTHANEVLARTLFAKGSTLHSEGKDVDALTVYDRLLRQFQGSAVPAVQAQVVRTLASKAVLLAKLGDNQTAASIREEILRRHKESDVPEYREAVAVAWIGKIGAMGVRGDSLGVVAECDEMLRRFSDVTEPDILRCVVIAFAMKSTALDALNRKDEALATLDAMMTRVGKLRSPILTESFAAALSLRSIYLRDMGHHDEAKAARTDLVRRFQGESATFAQQAVAGALIDEVRDLNASNRFEEALRALEDYLRLFPDSMDPVVRKNFYGLLVGRSELLRNVARYREAVASADDAYDRLAAASDPEAQALIPHALNSASFARLCLAKQTWRGGDDAEARALLEEAASKSRLALERGPTDPSALGNAAYVAFLLGNRDEARDMLTRAIALGGNKVREAELKNADICTLPQDDAFRELVRSIPDAPQPSS